MGIGEALFEFIKSHYVIEYWVDFPFEITHEGQFRPKFNSNRRIIIKDVHDDKFSSSTKHIDICTINNVSVVFIWSKIETIAGFDLYHKSVNNLPSLIMNIFRDSKSKDFYKFLIEQDMKVIIPLKMITEEFPKLYDGLPEDFKFSHSND